MRLDVKNIREKGSFHIFLVREQEIWVLKIWNYNTIIFSTKPYNILPFSRRQKWHTKKPQNYHYAQYKQHATSVSHISAFVIILPAVWLKNYSNLISHERKDNFIGKVQFVLLQSKNTHKNIFSLNSAENLEYWSLAGKHILIWKKMYLFLGFCFGHLCWDYVFKASCPIFHNQYRECLVDCQCPY